MELAPADAVFNFNLGGYLGTPVVNPPAYTRTSVGNAPAGSVYYLWYASSSGTVTKETTPSPIVLGWNLLTRIINGQLYTFLVQGT
jgi:hypothetical protein